MLLLSSCTESNLVEIKEDAEVVDTGGDTGFVAETDSGDTAVADGEPFARITSPEPGTASGCDGLTLTGEVGGGDGRLVVKWYGDGVELWSGAPESDGTTTLTWDPSDGAHTWTLTATDEDGDHAEDSRDVAWEPVTAGELEAAWERSEMDDRVSVSSVGACVPEAILLPTQSAWVWDSGDYTPAGNAADGTSAGRKWASWDQVGPVDCHLFRLTIELPACGFSAVRLSSPWYSGVPINDNLYVVVGGSTQWYGGTSYGGAGGGPGEVDGWMAGTIADLDASLFVAGTNEILIVTEEYASWGGMGFLEATLVE